MDPTYERITADDVQIGDHIARTRNDKFERVDCIAEGPAARRFQTTITTDHPRPEAYGGGFFARAGDRRTIMRPRRTAKLWREVPADV